MKLRCGFMGSPDFAVPSLRAVAEVCDLRVVVCQPDRPAGRGRKLKPPAVKAEATRLGTPLLQPTKMKDGTLAAALAEHDLDLIVVVAFGRILPPDVLGIPRHGCINVHGSILPRWRGAAPIQRAVLAGDRETGVAIMQMDEGLDTGPVFSISRTEIGPHETSGQLFERLSELGGSALSEFLRAFPNVPPPVEQDHAAATHAAMLRKPEGRVAFEQSAARVVDHIRGMDPWPTAFVEREGEPMKLFGARVSSRELGGATPGRVLGVDADGLHVACADGAVSVAEVAPAGRRRMAASAYAAGRPFGSDESLG